MQELFTAHPIYGFGNCRRLIPSFRLDKEGDTDYLLFAPQLFARNDTIFFLGDGESDPLCSFFLTRSHELVNQG